VWQNLYKRETGIINKGVNMSRSKIGVSTTVVISILALAACEGGQNTDLDSGPEGEIVVPVLFGKAYSDGDTVYWRDQDLRFQSEPKAPTALPPAGPSVESAMTGCSWDWEVQTSQLFVAYNSLELWEDGIWRELNGSIASACSVRAMTVDQDAVYLGVQDSATMSLIRVDLATNETTTLQEGLSLFDDLLEDGDTLYLIEDFSRVISTAKTAVSGSAAMVLFDEATIAQWFTGEKLPQPTKLAVDDDYLYLTVNNQNGAAEGGILKWDKAEGTITALVKDEQYPRGLAVDTEFVYWVHGIDDGNDAVVRMPKQGGEIEVVAAGQTFPVEVLLTSNRVYWVNAFGATNSKYPELRSIAKPPRQH
jgi:hypothetical protein